MSYQQYLDQQDTKPNGIFTFAGLDYLVTLLEDKDDLGIFLVEGLLKPDSPRQLDSLLLVGRKYEFKKSDIAPLKGMALIYDIPTYASYMYMLYSKIGNTEEANKWKPLLETHVKVHEDGKKNG